VAQEFRQSGSWSSFALLWFLECGKLRVLELVLVWVVEFWWRKNSGNLGVGQVLLCFGSLSVGSLGSWSWSWCGSWSWWRATIQAILELVKFCFALVP
jgi:hypothetical protein